MFLGSYYFGCNTSRPCLPLFKDHCAVSPSPSSDREKDTKLEDETPLTRRLVWFEIPKLLVVEAPRVMRAFSLGSANRPFIWEGNLNDVIESERSGTSMLEMEETICLQLLCEPAPSTLVPVKVHYRMKAAIEAGVYSKDLDASSTSSTTHVPTQSGRSGRH